jgi:hypothetical protein
MALASPLRARFGQPRRAAGVQQHALHVSALGSGLQRGHQRFERRRADCMRLAGLSIKADEGDAALLQRQGELIRHIKLAQ